MSRDGSSVPPPPGNPGTAAWYELQRLRRDLESFKREYDDQQGRTLRELGEVRGDVDHLKKRARKSLHDLRELQGEVQEWQETSEIRDLRQQLLRTEDALEQAKLRAASGRPARRGKLDIRAWAALISAVVITIATAIAAALQNGRAPHVEVPAPTQLPAP